MFAVLALAQVDSAVIQISLGNGEATVVARYYLPAPDSLGLSLMRLPGQAVRMLEGTTAPDTLAGLQRVTILPRAGRAEISFELEGDLSRIPIPVPDMTLTPGGGRVRIHVAGVPPGRPLDNTFPRLAAVGTTAAMATPSSLPSFVRPPSRHGMWTTNRIAELGVLALIGLATLSWIARRRSQRRVGSAARGE